MSKIYLMWPPLIQFLTNSIPSSLWINFSVTHQGWTFQSLLTRPIRTNPPMVLAEMLQFRPDTSRVQPVSEIDAPAFTLVLRRHLLINTQHGTLALTSASTCLEENAWGIFGLCINHVESWTTAYHNKQTLTLLLQPASSDTLLQIHMQTDEPLKK